MTLDKTVIDKAVEKKYTEFSDVIKTELQNKMSSHPDAVKYAGDYDKIQTMKQMFAQINGQSEE
jgi:5'-deoxynucleotidase YfbR-like HD superfamily hydrolase